MIRQLGLAHFSAIDVPPEEFVVLAAEAGFARVGLRLVPPFAGAPHYPLQAGTDALRRLSRICSDVGVEVYDIEAVVIDAQFSPGTMKPVLEAATELGASRLTVSGDDIDSARLAENFLNLCALAAPFAMNIDIENMGWRSVATYSDAYDLVASTKAENAGVLVDAIHFFRNGGNLAELNAGMARINSVQICDVRGPVPTTSEGMVAEARAGRFAPGEGDLPLQELLNAVHPDSKISIEVPMIDNSRSASGHIRHLMAAAQHLQ